MRCALNKTFDRSALVGKVSGESKYLHNTTASPSMRLESAEVAGFSGVLCSFFFCDGGTTVCV